jgi:hypothetical protein
MDQFLIWFFLGPLIVGAVITVLALISTPFVMFWEKIKSK